MASTSIRNILSLFLLLSCIWTQLSVDSTETAKQNDDSIQKVCSKVVLPDFCIKTLKPYLRSATADLTSIAKVSLDLAQSRANTTKSLILTLFKRASDPKSGAILTECTSYFNKAIGYLNEAKKYLAAKDYNAVNNRAEVAQSSIDDCNLSLVDGPSRNLRNRVVHEFVYCNMLCETAGLLLGGDYLCM